MTSGSKTPLPLIDRTRTEFGYYRTRCSCSDCILNCKFIPGYLIPADLERMIPKSVDPLSWASENLLASPGAVMMNSVTGQTFRIPTLVPARKPDGSCVHLDGENHCAIHEVAPFGCSFMDHTMSVERSNSISIHGLRAIQEAHSDPNSLYTKIWRHLVDSLLVSPSPEENRQRMKAHWESLQKD